MISLKSKDTEAEATYRRVIGLLLQGIALHAVEGTTGERKRFQEQMDQCIETSSSEPPVSELLALVGRVLRAMEDYNTRTGRFVQQQSADLQQMVSLLIQTLIEAGIAGQQSSSTLQQIEKSLGRIIGNQDIRILRLRMDECLAGIREEAARKNSEPSTVESSAATGDTAVTSRDTRDAATGLKSKEEADRAIRAASEAPEGKYLLIAVLSRVQAINARFGYALGDRILADFAVHFTKGLSPTDQIFRWKGPAMLAVLDRPGRVDAVRADVRRFADAKLERTLEVGQRTIHISTSATWSLIQVVSPFEDLMQQVEAFAAAQLPREYA